VSITVDLSAQDLAAIKQLTRLHDDAEAIAHAARQFVRLVKLRELKSASGNVEFENRSAELEDLELNETSIPR
jgi:hypothetical protein